MTVWGRRGPSTGPWQPRRLLVGGGLSLGILLLWAAPAGAHAAVVSSSPAQGQRLAHAPSAVTIVFDQPVKPDDGGVVVLNSSGQKVNLGTSAHPVPDTLRAALSRALPDGAYVANYTVTSVDGHVVSGGLVFLVGNARPGSIATLTRQTTSAATWYDRGGQFLIYVGVLAAGGLAFFLAFLFPEGTERRQLGRWCAVAAGLGVVGMVATGAAQADLAGGGLGALAHWTDDQPGSRGEVRHPVRTAARGSGWMSGVLSPARSDGGAGHGVLWPSRFGGSVRGLWPCSGLPGTMALDPGRCGPRHLRRHVVRWPHRTRPRPAQPGSHSPSDRRDGRDHLRRFIRRGQTLPERGFGWDLDGRAGTALAPDVRAPPVLR